VIPFRLVFSPGIALSEQVVYAATKAIVSGQLRPGDPFPSVRTLSKELKINPNTAHKVVMQLTARGLVEVLPGIGTVVAAALPKPTAAARAGLLGGELEGLVVEAKKLGMQLDDVLAAVARHWQSLGGTEPAQPVKGSRKNNE
jgi:GntR family transcriptional regulator